jgi:hypothetical protein
MWLDSYKIFFPGWGAGLKPAPTKEDRKHSQGRFANRIHSGLQVIFLGQFMNYPYTPMTRSKFS